MSTDEAAVPPAPEQDLTAAPVKGRSGLRPWLLGGLVGAAIGAGGVGAVWALSGGDGPKSIETFELKGSMSLVGGSDEINQLGDAPCRGMGGYSDIRSGAAVTVYDATGAAVGTGSLGIPVYDDSNYVTRVCRFPVSVPDVPKGSAIYQVEVTHRGKVSLKAAEAEAGKFSASLG